MKLIINKEDLIKFLFASEYRCKDKTQNEVDIILETVLLSQLNMTRDSLYEYGSEKSWIEE